jgi:hypothetical protein
VPRPQSHRTNLRGNVSCPLLGRDPAACYPASYPYISLKIRNQLIYRGVMPTPWHVVNNSNTLEAATPESLNHRT